jgi:sugar diacid utilization regulator
LSSLERLRVVGGQDGLDRIIRWVHISDIPQVEEYVQGGELLFITGIEIRDNVSNLLKLIEEIRAKRLAGLVINIGPYIKKVPQEAIVLADHLHFPVFELPWEVKIVDVTQVICKLIVTRQTEEQSIRDLINNILFSDFELPEVLVNRGARYNYDLTRTHRAVIVDLDNFAGYLKKKKVVDENQIMGLKNYFEHIVLGVLSVRKVRALTMPRSDSIILLIPEGDDGSNQAKKLAEEIREAVANQMPDLTVSIGLGDSSTDLKNWKKSFQEAEQALQATKSNNASNTVTSFRDLGLFKILFHVSEKQKLLDFYQEMLDPLAHYDKIYKTHLVETLDVFLSENGNMLRAAQRLYAHRNTLRYRLRKIEEVSGRDLADASQRLNYQVALTIGRFLGYSKQ